MVLPPSNPDEPLSKYEEQQLRIAVQAAQKEAAEADQRVEDIEALDLESPPCR